MIFLWFLWCTELHKVEIQPWDFQDEGRPETFFQRISQLTIDDDRLAISDWNTPWILILDREGEILETVGRGGAGPNEFGQGVLGFAKVGNRLLVHDLNYRVHLFVEGQPQTSFKRQEQYFVTSPYCSAAPACDEHLAVLPNSYGSKFLGVVYNADGERLQSVGKIPVIPDELKQTMPFVSDNFWIATPDSWYCVMKYRPIAFWFSKDFARFRRLDIDGPELAEREAAAFQLAAEQGKVTDLSRYANILPFFTDGKFFRGDLFLFTKGCLYQIDPQNGNVRSRTYFYGTGADFKQLNPLANVAFQSFAFFSDGTLVLGSKAMLWNHDLWTAQLPYFKGAQP